MNEDRILLKNLKFTDKEIDVLLKSEMAKGLLKEIKSRLLLLDSIARGK